MCTTLTETPTLDGDPLDIDPPKQRPPGRNMAPGTEKPPEGTWDQAARQEVTSYRDLPCGQTDTCKNITLPQTSFADGNYKVWNFTFPK